MINEEDFLIKGVISQETLRKLEEHIRLKPLKRVILDTEGGDLRATISMIASIKNLETEPLIIADGKVYSAGAFFFLSFKNRCVVKNSTMFIHDVGINTVILTRELIEERKKYRRQLCVLLFELNNFLI